LTSATDAGEPRLIPLGEIAGTHGVRGEIKVRPAADSAEFLLRYKRFFVNGAKFDAQSARVHKGAVLIKLSGVDTLDAAAALRGAALCAARGDAPLPEGTFFVADVIGFTAIDDAGGAPFGTVEDYITLPSNGVFVVRGRSGEELIPDAPGFVPAIDAAARRIRFRRLDRA